jgi:hypothetical protein
MLRVLISYSADSEEHCTRVLEMARHLLLEGVEVRLDRFHRRPNQGWWWWWCDELDKASFVIMVCTSAYRERVEGAAVTRRDDAMAIEELLIAHVLGRSERKQPELVPVLFAESDADAVPTQLRGLRSYVLPREQEELGRRLPGYGDVTRAASTGRDPGALAVLSSGSRNAIVKPTHELFMILADLFSADDFRRWLGLRYSPDLLLDLPGGNPSQAAFFGAGVEVLARHGSIDEVFFANLRDTFPRRAEEIAFVGEIWAHARVKRSNRGTLGLDERRWAVRRPRATWSITIASLLILLPFAAWGLEFLVGGDPPSEPEGEDSEPEAPAIVSLDSTSRPQAAESGRGDGTSTQGSAPKEPRSCPKGMVYIRGTTGHEFVARDKQRELAGFCMAVTETTVAEYRQCMETGKCKPADTESFNRGKHNWACNAPRSDRDRHPVNCVSWHQAQSYCESIGARLPTEWEWEWAARGRDEARAYPWGNRRPTCEEAIFAPRMGKDGCGKNRTWEVGSLSLADSASRDGLVDLLGNVREWTSSSMGDKRVTRGGGWATERKYLMIESEDVARKVRPDFLPDTRGISIGFRCAMSIER